MKAVAPKQVWTAITDPVRAKAIMDQGKYREDKPTWILRDGTLWVLKDEYCGKISGTSQSKVP